MPNVLIATEKPFAEAAVSQIMEVFENAGYQVRLLERFSAKAELLEAVKTAEAILIRSELIDEEVLAAAPVLKLIVRAGAGYDNVDIEAASRRGFVVMNTPGQNSNAVAELAIGLAIYALRAFYSGANGSEMRGKVLGLHGYGYVARNVKRIARGFGMDVVVYTRYSRSQAISEGIDQADSLEELYAMSDVVSIHVPARGEHIKSVSYDILRHLKNQAVIVNTARKEVINEDDLIRIMRERPDIKYVSDIAPDCSAYFEQHFKGRFYFTPKKIGAQTTEANSNAGVAAANQIVAFFEKGETTFQVNKEKK